MTGISSTYGLNLALVNSLSSQQSTLALLSEELTTQQKYSNLTDYDPTSAHTMLDVQNAVTQKQSYLASIQTVQTRLSVYDSTMTDMETIANETTSLSTGNSAYSASTAANLKAQATSYLDSLTDDLNQQVGGRYIYAGTRYTTPPVTNLALLTGPISATPTTSPTLASYDTDYGDNTSFTVNSAPTGTFQMGDTTIDWNQLEGNSSGSVFVSFNGTVTSVPVSGLNTSSTPTAAQVAQNLSLTLNAIAASGNASATGVPSALTTTADASGNVTLNLNGANATAVTPDVGGTTGETTWVGGTTPDGTTTETPSTSTTAYNNDSVLIDSSYSITYGVSSNDPSIQNLISSLRSVIAAVNAGQSGDTAGYATLMSQAEALSSNSLIGIQTLHTGVANNEDLLSKQTSTQNADITALQNQLGSITNVDLTQVGTELNLLQTQLQASYSATATLEKLSLVSYL